MALKQEDYEAAIEFAYGKKPSELDSLDAAKELQSKRVVLIEEASKNPSIVGKILGSAETALKSEYKEFIGDDNSEFRKELSSAERFIDKLAVVKRAVAAHTQKEVAAVEERLKQKPDERISILERERDDYKNKFSFEKEAREKAVQGIKEWEDKFSTREKEIKIDHLHKAVWSGVPIDPTLASDAKGKLALEGFQSTFERKYKKELDESGNLVYLEKESGKPVADPKRQGAYLTPLEIAKMEVEAAGIGVKSPIAGQRVPVGGFQRSYDNGSNSSSGANVRPINNRFGK